MNIEENFSILNILKTLRCGEEKAGRSVFPYLCHSGGEVCAYLCILSSRKEENLKTMNLRQQT